MSNPFSQPVKNLMTKGVHTLDPNDALVVAERLAEAERIRHFPVLDEEGTLVGILSQRDIFHRGLIRAVGYGGHAREKLLESLLVKEVMVSQVVTTTPETPISQAAHLMLESKVGCLPVLEGTRLVGILSETDLVALIASGR